jgi:hypothetical protein
MRRSDDELRKEIRAWTGTIDRAHSADTNQWNDLVAIVAEIEREEPKLKDREYMLEQATELVTDALRKRQQLRFPIEWYRRRISKMLVMYAQPYLLIAELGIMMDHSNDPTDSIDNAARKAELATEFRRPRYS